MMPGMNQGPGMYNGFNGGDAGINGMGMGYNNGFSEGGWNGMTDFNGTGYYSNGGYDQSQHGYFGQMQHQHSMPRNNYPNPHNRFNNGGHGGFGAHHRGGFNGHGGRNANPGMPGFRPHQFGPGVAAPAPQTDAFPINAGGVSMTTTTINGSAQGNPTQSVAGEGSDAGPDGDRSQSHGGGPDGSADAAGPEEPMPIANVADMDMDSNMHMHRSRMLEQEQQSAGMYNGWQQQQQSRSMGRMGFQGGAQIQSSLAPANAPTGPSGKPPGQGLGVEGAPTGPRALREGLSFRGARMFGRGGFGPNGFGRQQSRYETVLLLPSWCWMLTDFDFV